MKNKGKKLRIILETVHHKIKQLHSMRRKVHVPTDTFIWDSQGYKKSRSYF